MPFGGHRQPPGRGEVEGRGIAPQLADHGTQTAASYALFHRPQRVARIAGLDMDKVAGAKARRVDSSAFQDRHPLLHPQ